MYSEVISTNDEYNKPMMFAYSKRNNIGLLVNILKLIWSKCI